MTVTDPCSKQIEKRKCLCRFTDSEVSLHNQLVLVVRNCGEQHTRARVGEKNLSAHGNQKRVPSSDLPQGPNSENHHQFLITPLWGITPLTFRPLQMCHSGYSTLLVLDIEGPRPLLGHYSRKCHTGNLMEAFSQLGFLFPDDLS